MASMWSWPNRQSTLKSRPCTPFEMIFVCKPRKNTPYKPSFSTTRLKAVMYEMESPEHCLATFKTRMLLEHVSLTAGELRLAVILRQ